MSNPFSNEAIKQLLNVSDATFEANKSLVAGAYDLYETTNETLPEVRRIDASTIVEISNREGGDTPQAAKAIIDFVSTVENPATNSPTVHTDLLPLGHPMVAHGRQNVAQYYGSTPTLSAHVQTLVASAIAAEPGTATRKFFSEQLIAAGHEIDALHLVEDADRILKNN
jgi:hypothetical protein